VSGLAVSGSGFAISGGSCAGAAFELEIGASCDVQLTYTANDLDADAGALDFSADAPSNIASVALAGTGVQGSLSVSPAMLDFGDVRVGTDSDTQQVTFANTGSAPLEVSALVVSGATFSAVGGDCALEGFELQPEASCTVMVVFAPAELGSATGSMTFSTEAPSDASQVELVGNGVMGALTVDPLALDFGDIQVGTSS